MKTYEVLKELKLNGPKEKFWGICGNMDYKPDSWHDFELTCYLAWSKYSGDLAYPIPNPYTGQNSGSPGRAFNLADANEMWNPEHPYGALRLELLDHCIKWFESRDL